LNGKIADIAHANSIEPIVIFDLTRTQADTVMDHVYALIDSFKKWKDLLAQVTRELSRSVSHLRVKSLFDPNPGLFLGSSR
jgi:hypothetical protein